LPHSSHARKPRRKPPPPKADWAWFFDIDGTLVEIASSPSSVVVHDELPDLIAQLHVLSGGAVSLITGRSIADVDRFLPLPGISVAGQHGLELRTAGGRIISHPVPQHRLDDLRLAVSDAVARHPALIAEFKGSSIALHYRLDPRLGGYAHRLMNTLMSRYTPDFAIQKGKRVVELRPAAIDKGGAIRELMSTEPFAGRVPVFVGDDVTDEIGFAVVNDMLGHSVKVGGGRTAAKWRLRDVTEVRDWLRSGVDASIAGLQAEGASRR
jgi:trehalose 6-phosphate phosphatase